VRVFEGVVAKRPRAATSQDGENGLRSSGSARQTALVIGLAGEFRDGVWLVELPAIADPALVPQAIVSALGVRERPGEAFLPTLARALSTRELLLVLDNCEHVIDVCAEVTDTLLSRCPRMRVMATSREALGTSGEVAWRVPSLTVPDVHAPTTIEHLSGFAATRLFVARAEAARPDFRITPESSATCSAVFPLGTANRYLLPSSS